MIESIQKYWLEVALASGMIIILMPTILAPVFSRIKQFFVAAKEDDQCLEDLDIVLKLQKKYPSTADSLESVAMGILKYHREH